MGEHLVCNQEVIGSIPVASTKLFPVFMISPVDLITDMSDNVYSEKTERELEYDKFRRNPQRTRS